MKNFIILLSTAVMLMFTSCEQYVLPQEVLEYSLSVFNQTMTEYEANLDKLHDLEIQQEMYPEEKDSLAKQIDSLFLQMSYLIGMHESSRVALEKLSGKAITEITPAPVVVPVYRYAEAMKVFRNADASLQKEERLLQQLKGLMPIGKNVSDVKKSERKVASFQAYYVNFAYIMRNLRPEKARVQKR